jgi:hypothetical protein
MKNWIPSEDEMTNGTPIRDSHAVLSIPEPEPADYSDEMTSADVQALRDVCTQDESKMGALVHGFTW